jgi:TonB family protein
MGTNLMSTPAHEPDFDTLPCGEVVHRYMIDGVIGRGGFGITYRVQDTARETFVLKEYFPRLFAQRRDGEVVPAGTAEHAAYHDGLDRFLSEAKALRRLSAVGASVDGIVKVITFFEGNGTGYIVMEHLTGRRLDSVLAAHPQGLSVDAVNALAYHLLRALDHVHGAHFHHGDMTPANIMLREDGHPVLLDFGAARNASAGPAVIPAETTAQDYAPIEQRLGMELGPYSDVYALGAMLYQAIGGTPVDAVTRHRALSGGGADPQPPAVEIGADRFDRRLLRMIDQAAAVPPEARPQAAAAMLALLDSADPEPEPPWTAQQPVEPSAVEAPTPTPPIGEPTRPEDETQPPPAARSVRWRAMALPFLVGAVFTGLLVALAFVLLKPAGAPPSSVSSVVASAPVPAHASGRRPEPAPQVPIAEPPPMAVPPTPAAPTTPVAPLTPAPPVIEPAKSAPAAAPKPAPVEPPKPMAPPPPKPPVAEPINRPMPDPPKPPVPAPAPAMPAPRAAISTPGDRPPEAAARDARPAGDSPAPHPAHSDLPDAPVGNRLSGPALVYPPALEKNGREGSADIACTVDADGTPSDCKIVRLWGPPDFGESALAYVRGSTYRPARRGGVNVSDDARFHIEFRQSK